MNKKLWIISTAAVIVATTAAVLTVCKQRARQQKRLAVISDAGYETAHDVHFPLKRNKAGRKSQV